MPSHIMPHGLLGLIVARCRPNSRAQSFFDSDIHRVELMVPRHLFGQLPATGVLKNNEVPHQVEKPALVKNPFQDNLQLRQLGCGIFTPRNRAPGLKPFLPGPE